MPISRYFENAIQSGKRISNSFIGGTKRISELINSGFDKAQKIYKNIEPYVDSEDRAEFSKFSENFKRSKTEFDRGLGIVEDSIGILTG